MKLIDLISSYVELKEVSPGVWLGKCPFHEEKTPSFTVKTEGKHKGFYCFGCGRQGGIDEWVEYLAVMHPKINLPVKELLRDLEIQLQNSLILFSLIKVAWRKTE